MKKQFEEAWKYGEVDLKASVIDPAKRKNIAIRIDENSPNALVYVAGLTCVNN